MDAAVYAFAGSIAVAVIGGAVAVTNTILNARHGRENAAKAGMDEMRARELAVKDERITFRDEQLLHCQGEVSYWKSRAERAEAKT